MSLPPCTTLNTPSGSPAAASSSASLTEADGSRSDGLSTNALPHAIAGTNIQIGTMAGKLNGVMPAATPSGARTLCVSTPRATPEECSPLRWVAMPVAWSTTSMPRASSPRASSTVLPCSEVMMRASSSWCSSSKARNLNMTLARLAAGVADHAGNALSAAATAASTSLGPHSATWPCSRPVAGSKMGWVGTSGTPSAPPMTLPTT